MKVLSATTAELKKSFDFSGRIARGPYLSFLAISTILFALVLCTTLSFVGTGAAHWVVLGVAAVFYIPVTSAGVRRLHDVGAAGTLMLDPLKPAFAGLVLVWLLPLVGGATFTMLWVVGALFFPVIIAALISIALLGVTAATLIYFSNTMGLLLLPSQPGPNTYGPNPNEVPQ